MSDQNTSTPGMDEAANNEATNPENDAVTQNTEETSAKNEVNTNNKWYVLRVIGGKEKKIKEYLEKEISRSEWKDDVVQILSPVEKVVKIVKGKKTLRDKILYPGYLLLEAKGEKMNDELIQEIKNTTGVIHFLGKDNPTPLRRAEVQKMFGELDDMSDMEAKLIDPFLQGESVKITDGPFNDFVGTVEEVDEDKKKVKVIVKIFGKDTPVELSFYQVSKVL